MTFEPLKDPRTHQGPNWEPCWLDLASVFIDFETILRVNLRVAGVGGKEKVEQDFWPAGRNILKNNQDYIIQTKTKKKPSSEYA